MYIAQTYFSSEIAGRADVFVYYVERPGDTGEHLNLVVSVFRELGEEYAEKVSLFAPDRSSLNRIRSQVEKELVDCFSIKKDETPGIIVSPKQITYIASSNDWVYLPLKKGEVPAKAGLKEVLVALIEQIREQKTSRVENGFVLEIKRLWDAIELKPGIFGIRFDLKKYGQNRRGSGR